MSYILEALRKSQQEREMTQAPAAALESLPGAVETRGSNRWIIATTLMAVVAVAISLYAVFGSRLASVPETVSSRLAVETARRPPGDRPDSASDRAPQSLSALASVRPSPPALEPREMSAGVSPDRPELTTPADSVPLVTPSVGVTPPAVEQPSPMAAPAVEVSSQLSPAAPREVATPDWDATQMTAPTAEKPALGRIEREVLGGQAPKSDALPVDPPQWQDQSDLPTTQRTTSATPDDNPRGFRREAELLRDRLLNLGRALEEEQQLPLPRSEGRDAEKASSRQTRPTVAKVEPQPRGEPSTSGIPSVGELPAHVFQKLPPRSILVHVYNESPEKRFIILNSQRQRQGDTTKDGFVIEEIRPDGVVLRFQSERFFNPR